MISQIKAAVGIAKCPATGKLYGVRIEERGTFWTATWAFAIKPEVAQREGYSTNEFPSNIKYEAGYLGCPYCKKHEDLAAISKGVSSAPKSNISIMVGTNSSYDDLGKVLNLMKIKWNPISDLKKCNILFLNCCGSAPDEEELRDFVMNGGCVFASCTQSSLLEDAFPESISFDAIGFETGTENVTVEDAELRAIVGKSIDIHFHIAGSGNPKGGNFETIMRGNGKLFAKGTNICVRATCGKGSIFFTMFHNSDNINEQEQALLQLLVLKELGGSRNRSLEETGADLGIDMDSIRSKFKFNF
jgi:hypothetical protein